MLLNLHHQLQRHRVVLYPAVLPAPATSQKQGDIELKALCM
uniref:Uncharacterized protein n=1 Tax=Arundo donax TaxID=35708 RepID=A0A0A9EKP2_ARUDO